MSKAKRLSRIREIIEDNKIASQQELLKILNTEGYSYTQATLSRDLKCLKAGKIQDPEKGMIYILPGSKSKVNIINPNEAKASDNGFISIDYTSNMAVVKTLPGFANSLAYKLDKLNQFEIIGTIAGDDTILVIGREGISKNDLIKSLEPVIPYV